MVVSNGSKILIWKQITTRWKRIRQLGSCFQWFKDTNLKANHNNSGPNVGWLSVVSNGSKILIWKQITTSSPISLLSRSCFQWFKDTNLKANHNIQPYNASNTMVVSNGSKILIWKQITTVERLIFLFFCCFQWFKDTNLKANHNTLRQVLSSKTLFPMVQRY